jgi:hypothetical protein
MSVKSLTAAWHDADDIILPDQDVVLPPELDVMVHETKLGVQDLCGPCSRQYGWYSDTDQWCLS